MATEVKTSLLNKFMKTFMIFGIIFLVLNAGYTFLNQRNSHQQECKNTLRNITKYLEILIVKNGDEFVVLRDYFKEHYSEMRVPTDFSGDYAPARDHFEELFARNYPEKTFGLDLGFEELEGETKRAYAEYLLEYWISVFMDATEKFGLSYTYFIYPDPEPTVFYLIDPVPESEEIDGKSYRVLGFNGVEDPEKYPVMWEAWHTGMQPSGYDNFDNEYGRTYTCYSPVFINGEKIGLVCADMSVEDVNNAILAAVIRQTLGSMVVFLCGIFVMGAMIRKLFVDRILNLEENIATYAQDKDPSISEKIRASEQGDDEIRSLSDQFAAMIVDLQEYMDNLQRVTAEKERIGAELDVAAQIQADMLPRIFPPFPERKEFCIYATMDPAKEVGGDFYDLFMVDDDHIALVVADVSGKGVPAALFMVISKTLIKNRTLMGGSPAEILADVNNQLCEGNEAELFVTVWLAIIEISTGRGIAANAGHEHPVLKRKDGSFELVVYKHSPALAVMEGIRYREHEFRLYPGDTVFQYSDGVTEATDINNELFGEKRLVESLNRHTDAGPEELLPVVRADMDAFVGSAPQFDDVTMLGFEYYGGAGDDPEDS